MNVFFVPFLYSYKSRFKKPIKFLSWFFIYLIPLFLITALAVTKVDYYLVIAFTLVVFNTYNLYEIGYIYNDTTTIIGEDKPTLRLNDQQINYFCDHKFLIYAFRILLSVVMIVLLAIFLSDIVDIRRVIGTSVLLLLFFYLYNSVRGRINLPLHFILVILRFSCVPLVFYNVNGYVELILLSIFLFPVPNLIERAGEKRFLLAFFQTNFFINKDVFRSAYYFIGLLVALIISRGTLSLPTILFGYFLSYRFLSSQVMSSKNL